MNVDELRQMATQLEQATITFKEAAELLEVHEAYARRIVSETLGETLITVHGKPLISRAQIEELAHVRKIQIEERQATRQQRETEKQEKARARLEKARAVLEGTETEAVAA